MPLSYSTTAFSQEAQDLAQEAKDSGGSARISKITIKGAKALGEREIERNMRTEFPSSKFWLQRPALDEEILKNDMARIKSLYAHHGYHDVQSAYELSYSEDRKRVNITINIEEGRPVILTEFDIAYKWNLSNEIKKEVSRALSLETGDVFSIIAYRRLRQAISEVLSNNGYPKAEVEGEALVNRRERWARVRFVIDPVAIYKFGTIRVEGNDDIESHIIEREADFEEGESYSLEKLNDTQTSILQLGLFRLVVVDPVFNDEDRVANVKMVVKERKHGSVKVGGGFGTEDKLRAQVVWTHSNFLGGSRRLGASGKFSFITQKVETSLAQPFILGKDSEVSGFLNFERNNVSSFESRGFLVAGRVQKGFYKNYLWSGSFNVQFSNVRDKTTGTLDYKRHENFFLTFFNTVIERNTTDSILNPSRGTVVSSSLESSFRALASEVNYLKGTLELRRYKKLRRLVLAKRLSVGVIQPFGSTSTFDVPIFKRFFAGGSSSMRGFSFQKLGALDEDGDPLGGNSLLTGSLELRFPLRGSFSGVAFFDYGNVYQKGWELPLDQLKYAPGLGLRYNTRIGPLGFDVGYALNSGSETRNFRFFLSIGQAF